jgi:lysozyme
VRPTKGHVASGLAGAAMAAAVMATPLIASFEGLWLTVKPDKLANGLPTGGYGETENVKLGETHTKEYWMARLEKRVPEYDAKIAPCIKVNLPTSARAAADSVAYNAGPGAVCRSPWLAAMNAGDIRKGCQMIEGWRVGSHPHGPRGPLVTQPGLVRRRKAESKLCLEGL